MAKVRLTWKDQKLAEDGVRIFRDTAPIDPQALPAPLASVPVGRGVFEDKTAPAGVQQHYYVAPFVNDEVGEGVARAVTPAEELPRFLYATQQIQRGYNNDGATLTLTVPDCKAGDLLVIFGARRDAWVSTPPGWTLGPVPADSDNPSVVQWTFAMWKIADGSEPGTQVTLQQASNVQLMASIAVIRHDSEPIQVTPLGTSRINGSPISAPFTFTNTNKPALVMVCTSWAYQTSSSECYIEGFPSRMIPMCRPTRWYITEPNARQMRFFAWFVEAAANEVYDSGTAGWSWSGATSSDRRSDIYLAIHV